MSEKPTPPISRALSRLARRALLTPAILCAGIAHAQTPAAPTGVRLDALDNSYVVSWNYDLSSVANLRFRIIARHNGTVVTEDGEDGKRYGGGRTERQIDFATAADRNGQTHSVQVRACSGNGTGNCGDWSAASEITVGAGRTPRALQLHALPDGFRANWSPPETTYTTTKSGADVTTAAVTPSAYEIRRAKAGQPFAADGTQTALRTTFTAGGLQTGATYQVQVAARTAHGRGAWSAAANVVTGWPGTPRRLFVQTRDRELRVSWEAPGGMRADGTLSYQTRWKPADAAEYAPAHISEPSALAYHAITALANDVTYDVQVRAQNAQGTGAWSAAARGRPLAPDDDWTLLMVTLTAGEWTPRFNPLHTAYTVRVDENVTRIAGTVTRNNNRAWAAGGFSRALSPGANSVFIKVYSPNRKHQVDYTLNIIRGELDLDAAPRLAVNIRKASNDALLHQFEFGGGTRTYAYDLPRSGGIVFFDIESLGALPPAYISLYAAPQDGLPDDGDEMFDDFIVRYGSTENVHVQSSVPRVVQLRLREFERLVTHEYEIHLTLANASALPAVTLGGDVFVFTEGAAAEIPVRLSSPAPAGGVSVTYTFARVVDAEDGARDGEVQFSAPASPLTFAEGETEKNIRVQIADNDFVEYHAQARIELRAPHGHQEGGVTSADIDIRDDETLYRSQIWFDGGIALAQDGYIEVHEGDEIRLPVRIAAAAAEALTFALRISAPAQKGDAAVAVKPQLHFPARTSKLHDEIIVRIPDDAYIEDAEDIKLTLAYEGDALAGLERHYQYAESHARATAILRVRASDQPGNAELSALSVSPQLPLYAFFRSGGTPGYTRHAAQYEIFAAHAVDAIRVTAAAQEAGARITVDGTAVTDRRASDEIALPAGAHKTIPIVVTARDNATTKTYALKAHRAAAAAPASATLRFLGVRGAVSEADIDADFGLVKTGALQTPGFDSAHFAYELNAQTHASGAQLFVAATFTAGARVTVRGGDARNREQILIDSETQAEPFLLFGENRFDIILTAPAGNAVATYTLRATRSTAAPGAVRNLRARAERQLLWFEWQPPASDHGAVVTTYQVRWRADADATFAAENAGAIPAAAQAYHFLADDVNPLVFEVAAVNAVGAGEFAAVTVTPRAGVVAPGAPVVTKLAARDDGMRVEWRAPFDNGGARIAAYRIRWRGGDNGDWLNAAGNSIDANNASAAELTLATQYEIANLPGAATYQVQVAAVNTAGAGAWSVTAKFLQQADGEIFPPATPALSPPSPAERALTFSWDAPLLTGGGDIDGYRIRWRALDANAAPGAWQKSSGDTGGDADGESVTARAYTAQNLLAGVTYEAQIAARNSAGQSAWSAGAHAAPHFRPRMSAPEFADSSLVLSWEAPRAGERVGGEYRVRWRRAGSGAWQKSSGAVSGDADGESVSARTYAVTNLQNGVTYEAQTRAAEFPLWSETRIGVPKVFDLNVDNAGGVTWRDGILIARYLLGLRGAALTKDLSSTAHAVVAGNIAAGVGNKGLDVDASETITAADGLLIARYLLGVRDGSLTAGQTDKTPREVADAFTALGVP